MRNRGLFFTLGYIPGTQTLHSAETVVYFSMHNTVWSELSPCQIWVCSVMSNYLIRKGFASLSKNGPPQRFLTIKVFSNKASLENNIWVTQSCMQKAYLQFAQEARCCLMLVSSAATAFIGCNHFFTHWPFSLHLLELVEKNRCFSHAKVTFIAHLHRKVGILYILSEKKPI